ncbi:TetR/AcrR family transcriptional regulator [Streptomyces sp. NPDC102462]|uniref:TetR/AcrR family transcriptional regulator n=1 Tax=Streptomyces sp. NPDC102462 TaxID=3366178 RepID=UPI0038009DE7
MTSTCGRSREPNLNLASAAVRRAQLVAAALRVMKREGIAAATTRAICAEADMPHGAFHCCFHSKQELYAALLSTDTNITLDTAWPVIDGQGTPAENFRTLPRTYWATVKADPEAQPVRRELVDLALREPALSELPAWEHRAGVSPTVITALEHNLGFQLPADPRPVAPAGGNDKSTARDVWPPVSFNEPSELRRPMRSRVRVRSAEQLRQVSAAWSESSASIRVRPPCLRGTLTCRRPRCPQAEHRPSPACGRS